MQGENERPSHPRRPTTQSTSGLIVPLVSQLEIPAVFTDTFLICSCPHLPSGVPGAGQDCQFPFETLVLGRICFWLLTLSTAGSNWFACFGVGWPVRLLPYHALRTITFSLVTKITRVTIKFVSYSSAGPATPLRPPAKILDFRFSEPKVPPKPFDSDGKLTGTQTLKQVNTQQKQY